MYTQFFGLKQPPFSISPDPRYLFMSERHREALAHLLYGINSGGGLVLLTGEIGTGKTTVCRSFLEQLPAGCNLAYIFNPKLTVPELLQSICDEFHIDVPAGAGAKNSIDALNRYLLAAHAGGRNSVLVIDEAQNLSAEVLEQLRLLTNLETNERKLLQIILIGQPELRTLLERPELRQLAQRVIAHYHLTALTERETASYIQHRFAVAGLASASPIQQPVMKYIHQLTSGVPRHINLMCDRALLGAYARGTREVDRGIVALAAQELFISRSTPPSRPRNIGRRRGIAIGVLAGAMALGTTAWTMSGPDLRKLVGQQWASSIALPEWLGGSTASVEDKESKPGAATAAATETNAGIVLASAVPSTLEAADTQALTEQQALAQLAQLWGSSADNSSCDTWSGELRCHRSKGGIAELRQLDRPAVVTLYDDQARPTYALLTALVGDRAQLGMGKTKRSIGIGELMRRFRGEFITLWRAPQTFRHTVEMRDRGPHVDWIATRIATLTGDTPPPAGDPFSQATVQQVRSFQQAQGLFVDGVVGPITLMHLNRAAGMPEPRLLEYAAAE